MPAFQVVVIGGGASGYAAVIAAARRGLSVLILEKAERTGKKILASGNGRCNLLGKRSLPAPYNTEEVMRVFSQKGLESLVAFFSDIGVLLKTEDDRMYPYSGESATVLNALRAEAERLGVRTETGAEVKSIVGKKPFRVEAGGEIYVAESVVFAAGSAAGFGADSLYLLEPYGHSASVRRPSLVPFLTAPDAVRGLRGVRTEAEATLFVEGKAVRTVRDELLFKDNGISGSAVFALSTALARFARFQTAYVSINFMPDCSAAACREVFYMLAQKGFSAESVFHKELARNIERRAGAPLTAKTAGRFAEISQNYEIEIKGLSAPGLAQVMSGGLDIAQFDFSTMESRIQPGLFAAGEALDVDGECGGYNLMWAWASGIVAGENVCKKSVR